MNLSNLDGAEGVENRYSHNYFAETVPLTKKKEKPQNKKCIIYVKNKFEKKQGTSEIIIIIIIIIITEDYCYCSKS